jgi:acyl CoA:acetate/3-ketoacid CoA transferase beta subunit
VTLGILGALQVDTAGSINSSLVAREDGSVRRFTGSGGANDIASLAGRVLVVMAHDERKFRDRLDFLTSPGRRVQGRERAELGLAGTGTARIVTDRAVLDVTNGGLTLVSVHPGEDPERVASETPVAVTSTSVGRTHAPTEDELRLIREVLDPHGWYTSDARGKLHA